MDKEKEIIKKVYQNLKEIEEINTADFYIMPKELYNKIFKKLIALERALKNSRKSRDIWKERYNDSKKGFKNEKRS